MNVVKTLIVGAIVLSAFLVPDKALAWTGDLPTCGFSPEQLATYKSTATDEQANINWANESASYAIVGMYGQFRLYYYPANSITVYTDTENRFGLPSASGYRASDVYSVGNPGSMTVDPYSTPASLGAEITCIEETQNISYNPNYLDSPLPGSPNGTEPEPDPMCEWNEEILASDPLCVEPEPEPEPEPVDYTERQAQIAQGLGILLASGLGIYVIYMLRYRV